MHTDGSFIESTFVQEDQQFEVNLRPQSLEDFAGQPAIKGRLAVMIQATKQRKETLSHCLFSGPPGLGKTTLASIVAKTMGSNLITITGPAIEKPGDLAGILTNLQTGDVLFIDEIHRLNRAVEEYLYTAMEDFLLDIMIDAGVNARSVQVNLRPFTLIGATTRQGLLTPPLRSRFPHILRLDFYEPRVLQVILQRTAKLMQLPIDPDACLEIAKRSRGTPRIANNILRWVRDFVQINHNSLGNLSHVNSALEELQVDHLGLDEMDRRILSIIIDDFDGGPVGLNTIATSLAEAPHTIEEVYEPYLIKIGFLKRTPRGREATQKAYDHLQIKNQGDYLCP